MGSNRLQLNTAKTELLWCSTGRRQNQIPKIPMQVGEDLVVHVILVRDLGIYLDSDATMRTLVSKTVSCCFAALRQIRTIRSCIPQQSVLSLVVSLLDNSSATLANLPANLTDRLQSVLNAAARSVDSRRRYDHVTPLLWELHWLKMRQWIEYKLAVLVIPLSQWPGAVVSRQRSSVRGGPRLSASPAFVVDVRTGRPFDTSVHRR